MDRARFKVALDSSKSLTIKWAKLVKFDSLVPMYPSGATVTKMGDSVYYEMKDGQILLFDDDFAATYNTLNDMSIASTKQDLFKFNSNKNSILRHEYLSDASSRHHDIIRVPGSRMMVVR